MLTSMCIVIFTVFYKTMAYNKESFFNVGTVLFSNNDLNKPHWTKTQISLLMARRYFQNILPPQDFKNSFTDAYVDIFLQYIKESYSNIKREAVDLETDSIMTAALSDTLGGYFKAWVLPVSKLNYYGGTISQDNVIKLFQFYGELKTYLDTDGKGWAPPDDKTLNYISINIAPTLKISKNMADPCNQLAYFEKTENGLGIPLPKVNWNDKSSTLFVPLKNMTLTPMIARDSSHMLVKYYDIAKNCLAESNSEELDQFDKIFQVWLVKNIIPHLKDEPLYLALGNVLTLLNMTRKHYGNLALKDRSASHGIFCQPIPLEVPSRKVTILLIILFLEVAWCIPALIYLFCSKKKKDCTSNVYLFVDQNKPDKINKTENQLVEIAKIISEKDKAVRKDVNTDRYSKNLETQYPSTAICRTNTITSALQLGRQNETYYMEFQGQCPSSNLTRTAGTGSRAYYSSKNQSSETIKQAPPHQDSKCTIINKFSESHRSVQTNPLIIISKQNEATRTEINDLAKKSSHSKESKTSISSNRNHNKSARNLSRRRTDGSKDVKGILLTKPRSKTYENANEGLIKVKNIQVQPGILQTPESGTTKMAEYPLMTTTESRIVDIENEQSSLFYFSDTVPICPSTGCVQKVDSQKEVLSGSHIAKERKLSDENLEVPTLSSNKPESANKQLIEIKSARPVKEHVKAIKSKKAILEVRDKKQYFEMTIDKPMTEINLNIRPAQINVHNTRSKIPKPNPSKLFISKVSGHIKRVLSPVTESKRKSLIPQLKKKAFDDMVLSKLCSKSNTYTKFNDTL